MTPYAKGTEVPIERSKGELEKLLSKYGAERFLSGWDVSKIVVGFEMRGRQVRLDVPVPSKDSKEVRETPGGRWLRSESEQTKAWQAAVRQRWRAIVLVVKAKLEAVEAGISTFESEFLGNLVLPGGATVAEVVVPRLDEVERLTALPPGETTKGRRGEPWTVEDVR